MEELAAQLRAEEISFVLDFVFNHISDEHEWLQKAIVGAGNGETTFFESGNAHVLSFMRHGQILFFGSFSEYQQTVQREVLAEEWAWRSNITDLVTG